jgi:hypothetical protein
MKLKFIPPPPPKTLYVATTHKSGKIGFSIATAKEFGITSGKSMELAVDEEDKKDQIIYAKLLDTVDEKSAYKILKGGNYHAVQAKAFLDAININYEKGNISFNVTEETISGTKLLKFTPREGIK